jgi:hypothetical protein
MQVKKNKYPHRVQKTHRQVPPTFFVPPGPKKNRANPKNMYRSKKGCPGSKNMHPKNGCISNAGNVHPEG